MTASKSLPLRPSLEWAAAQARRVIHDNDVERLKQLLVEHPALLSWRGCDWDSKGGLLGIATDAYGDAGDPELDLDPAILRRQPCTRGRSLAVSSRAVTDLPARHGLEKRQRREPVEPGSG